MYGRSLFNGSKGVDSEIPASTDCQKIAQHHVVVTNHFKQRFIKKYLSALQKENSTTIITSVDGKGTDFLVKLKLQEKLCE